MRLVPKIFLWFWLAIVAVGGTLVAVTEATHSRAKDDALWRDRYGPRVDVWARQAVQTLESDGIAGLRKYSAAFEVPGGRRNYVFDTDGNEVLGQDAPAAVRSARAAAGDAAPTEQRFFRNDRTIAESIAGASGRTYVVVAAFPQPSLLSAPLADYLSEDLGGENVIRLVAILAVAGVLCFGLARQIISPIDKLRAATRELANDHLATRVDGTILSRGDELADLGSDFDRMAERIETLLGAQRRLLSDVSHTLRSPLARLNLALGLARQQANPEVLGHLDRIERETDRLNTLIGQLLTMARVESGLDQGAQKVFDLGTLVEEVAADGDYEARSRQCVVQLRQPSPCLVEGSREMLRTAVENVVRNAVRHTAERTQVEIGVACVEVERHPRAVITIRDHGAGVPDAALGELFTPFHRVPDAAHPHADSTGLGLAITERAFRLHGGEVAAANAPGGGLVVTLQLPMRTRA